MPRQSISFTPPNDQWLKAQVESQEFSSKSDVVNDLIRIYRRGVQEFGETQAEAYFNAFFERFEMLAEQPLAYPAVDEIRAGFSASPEKAKSVHTARLQSL